VYFYRARLVKWITENNRPANIVNDDELHNLLSAGCPHITIPLSSTVRHEIKASFEKCHERVSQLLRVRSDSCNVMQDHPGCLHFVTDVWTSLNYQAFVVWTVHLQHQGDVLAFLLNIIEVPEVSYFFSVVVICIY
jgi:hypothetical protein